MIEISPRIDMDFGAGWVDVSEDVVSRVTAEWGVHGSSPKDRVADVGSMGFELDNSPSNSAGCRPGNRPSLPRRGFSWCKSERKATL